jgi:hypothetical protein
MKTIQVLLVLSCLNSTVGYCQLLSKPSLAVEDFEIALTNTDHLRKILEKHNFEYSVTGETRLNAPETMPNPLIPDLKAFRSEDWEPKHQMDQAIVKVTIYEWEANHAPLPGVIKTIRVMIRRNSVYSGKTNEFLEKIKNKYPNKSKKYFRNSEFYKSYGEPFNVFTNDSKIEVRTEKVKPIYSSFYILNFDLIM